MIVLHFLLLLVVLLVVLRLMEVLCVWGVGEEKEGWRVIRRSAGGRRSWSFHSH